MTLSQVRKAFLGFSLLLFFQTSKAQIEKGVSTIGGGAALLNTKQNNSFFRNSDFINFNPTYGRFLTDKIMVKGQLSGNSLNEKYRSLGSFQINGYKLETETRYYVNPESKWKYFGGAIIGIGTEKIQYYFPTYNKTVNGYTAHNINYGGLVGVNRFLTKDIAVEGRLSVNQTFKKLTSQTPIQAPSLKVTDIGLDIDLQNFMQFKQKNNDFEGLIDEGRRVIGAKFSAHVIRSVNKENHYNINQTLVTLDAEYGRFFVKGLLLGGKVTAMATERQRDVTASAYAQYFYPITKRFMIHAKGGLEMSVNSNSRAAYGLSLGLGASYFLTKNVAIDFNLINFNKSFISTNGTAYQKAGIGIGLRYFF